MKRVMILFITALLMIPGALYAQYVGVYFDLYEPPHQMHYYPEPFIGFDAHLYLLGADCFITGVEYMLATPTDESHLQFVVSTVEYPARKVADIGSPFSGHSIVYDPPLYGFSPGYNLLCTFKCFVMDSCYTIGGGITDYPVIVVPHSFNASVIYTCSPDHEELPAVGLTSMLCPESYAVKKESWGAIKSQYK
jgi:hypothetical protein